MPSIRPASIRQAELWQGLEQLGECRNPTLRWILHGFDENFEKKLHELKTTWNQKVRAYYSRCQPWRAKRRLVVPSSREAALFSRRALRQRENKVGLRTWRPVIWEPSTEQQRACEVVA